MKVAVYGSRPDGHAKVVIETLRAIGNFDVVGLLDDFPENAARTIGHLRVLGGQDVLPRLKKEGLEGVVFGFGNGRGRLECLAAVEAAGLGAPVLIHPTAWVSPSAHLAPGAQVMAGCVVQGNAVIGRAVLVNSGAVVEHDTHLGDGTSVGPGAALAGCVRVGARVQIGTGAVVLPGVEIGDDAVVGAGAVVRKPVGPGMRVAGVPARPI